MNMRVALLLCLSASPAFAQYLNEAARASPFADRWMTIHYRTLTQGSERVAGTAPFNRFVDGGGEWVARFSEVPEAHRLAEQARAYQRWSLATWWSGIVLVTGSMGAVGGVRLATGAPLPASVTLGVGIPMLTVFFGLAITSMFTGRKWQSLLGEAVKAYNSDLNARLPPEQRFNLDLDPY